MIFARNFIKVLLRRKRVDAALLGETKLDRCLSTFDLTALGIGSTLGLGIYVLAGEVASRYAGPAVTLSFFIAAVASVFAGLCYAEFCSRCPKAGSAYHFSYIAIGEFMAFIIGWNLVLEYVIGTASVARGYSNYIDSLLNGVIQKTLQNYMPINISGLSTYPDFLAFGITFVLTIMLAVGVKESTRFNSVFTVLNLGVVIFVVVAGSFHLNWDNWNITAEEARKHEGSGSGGFFPFGFAGVMSGAATCFYGFIGFDVIATTGEEAINPQKSIPISIVLSLLFVFLAYFGISAVQTLMLPYFMQTEVLTGGAPLPFVFGQVGWPVAKWIISIGALTGLSTSLLGAMFPLPRVLYSMASDGVIFRSLANVNQHTKTPIIATVISGIFAGLLACIFEVKELADMMSIGTLLAYSLVSISVMILRYGHQAIGLTDDVNRDSTELQPLGENDSDEKTEANGWKKSNSADDIDQMSSMSSVFAQFLNLNKHKHANVLSSQVATSMIVAITILLIIFDALLVFCEKQLIAKDITTLCVTTFVLLLLIHAIIVLACQPQSLHKISFQVPCVPYIPVLSMFVNFYLMLQLSVTTWIRFAVWMAIGLTIYFTYGIWNSNERNRVSAKLYGCQSSKENISKEVAVRLQ